MLISEAPDERSSQGSLEYMVASKPSQRHEQVLRRSSKSDAGECREHCYRGRRLAFAEEILEIPIEVPEKLLHLVDIVGINRFPIDFGFSRLEHGQRLPGEGVVM